MQKNFWVIVGVIAVLFLGILYASSHKKDANRSVADSQPTSHIKGKTDSKVKLVEYGDFQCPVCGSYYPTVSQVYEKYQDKIAFQFRNLPLTQVHQNAFAAARAAEAASNQGKYWEMYDLLFRNQTTWSQSSSPISFFKQYASSLGMNGATFEKDFSSDAVNKRINADTAAFKKTGDDMATPTFYLNGKKLELPSIADDNGPSVDKFSAQIDAALKAAGQQ